MNTYSLDLHFETDAQSDLPQPPTAYVICRLGASPLRICSNCVSAVELDFEIERLKKELDEIKKSGRQKFARYARTAAAAG